jgi:hypothetical protein
MLSRKSRHALLTLQRSTRLRLRSLSTTSTIPLNDTTDVTSKENSEDTNLQSAFRIDVRKNKPSMTKDTVWVSWYSFNPINMVHILNLVRYTEKHFGAVRNFLVVRVSTIANAL